MPPSPGNSGQNITYDFSNLKLKQDHILSIVQANDNNFPGATLAVKEGIASKFYKFSSAKEEYFGTALSDGSLNIIYSEPETKLIFPFSYSNTFNDAFKATQTYTSYIFKISGTTVVTADGYGTLIIPSGSFTNVLRIKRSLTMVDSIYMGETYAGVKTIKQTEYEWYANDSKYPIMTLVQNDKGVTSSVYYSKTQPTAINELYSPDNDFSVQVTGNLLLVSGNMQDNSGINNIRIYTSEGRLISEKVFSGKEVFINLPDSYKGIIFLRLLSGKTAITKKYMKVS
jgi:hypothetical protein